jgi:hypothetical protein
MLLAYPLGNFVNVWVILFSQEMLAPRAPIFSKDEKSRSKAVHIVTAYGDILRIP